MLVRAQVVEHGKRFETGRPVRFHFSRNTKKAPPALLNDNYQQRIEPVGRYVLHTSEDLSPPPGWVEGFVSFKNPLVIFFNARSRILYDEHSWKRQLENHYGKRGKALSKAIVRDGYDGVVTVGDNDTMEIVDLTWLSS